MRMPDSGKDKDEDLGLRQDRHVSNRKGEAEQFWEMRMLLQENKS